MRGRGPAILAIALGVANGNETRDGELDNTDGLGIYIFKPMLEEQAAQKQALLGVDEKYLWISSNIHGN